MIRRMMLAGSAGSRVLLLLVVLLGWKVAAQQKPVHVERESIRPKTAEMKRTDFLGDLISWEDGVDGTSKSVFTGGA